MLRVYSSNRLEVLADVFVQRFGEVAVRTRDPLRPLELVVPSMGTGQWLRHTMADVLGIAAQFEARLPASFAWQVFRAFDPSLPLESEYTLDRLRWRLFHLLPSLQAPLFAPLREYLTDADEQRAARKRFQLATRLAVLFDQYLVYRRDWITAFEGAPFAHARDAALFEREPWQAALWQRVVADIGTAPHRARVFDAVLERVLDTGTPLPATIPPWVTVFGVPALPPDLTLLFGALGTRIDVDVLVPNACSEYWAQIVSPRALAVRELRNARVPAGNAAPTAVEDGDEPQSFEGEYYETGQPLLASCGRMSRDGVDLLNELVEALGADAQAQECFVTPDAGADATMLERLQGDILALRLPDSADFTPEQRWVRSDDDSIQVHVCHSALREVEVLHDRLLAGFASDPTLEPRHVVVMVPDLETYAPIIEAVFDSVPPARRIRVAIADRLDEGAAPVLAALRQLMRLDSSRWTASEVLALLDIPAIQARFELADERLQQARHWLRESGVRWGRDADDWRRRGLPVVTGATSAADGTGSEQPNTWAFGLERLLLGYAMPDGAPVFDGVAPVPGVEGQSARALDGVLRLLAQLRRIERELRAPADASTWQLRIERWVNALFAPARDDADTFLALRGLRDVLRRFVADQPAEHASEVVPAAVVREYLEDAWEITPETPRYLTGAVTVCTLLPMRSIPFAHVHLLGMNERDFPRQASPPTFDLMAHGGRRKGDRVRRDEDRQLFLDAVLSARQRLHLSYVGLSDRSGAARNPSVLVSELLEVLALRFVMQQAGAELHAHLVHAHPLQPFSGKYDGKPLVTFEDLWTQTSEPPLQVTAQDAGSPQDASAAATSTHIVSPQALRQFLRRPARWTLRNLLDAQPAEDIDTLDDDEPMALDGLERYALQTEALDALRAGRFEDWCAQVRASGQLPHGLAGSQVLERWRTKLTALLDRAGEQARAPLRSIRIDLPLVAEDGATLHVLGDLDRIGPAGYVHLRVGKLKPRDFADAYLAQLLLCASNAAAESCVVDEAKKRELPAIEPAIAQSRLARIVAMYLEARERAVPLFVDTAQAWAQSEDEGKALRAWGQEADPDGIGARFASHERFDTDVQLVWGDLDAPPGDWQRCADAVYGDFALVFPPARRGKADDEDATP